jgi:guanylate kinase
MPFDGVILYGPPASGKDTVTAELCTLSNDYAYFEKLKVGEGRTSGYRLVAEDRLAELRNRGLIVHEVTRYGSNYAIDAGQLDELFKGGRVPVVHMGQVAGVNAMRKYGARWLNVLLWCSRDAAVERLRVRGSVDIEERLAVWDATLAVLRTWADPRFTLSIRTDAVQPTMAAAIIHAAMSDRTG